MRKLTLKISEKYYQAAQVQLAKIQAAMPDYQGHTIAETLGMFVLLQMKSNDMLDVDEDLIIEED